MWVFCCGMYRSGSTLQYQIAIELVTRKGLGSGLGYVLPETFKTLLESQPNDTGLKIVKTHAFFPEAGDLLRSGKAKALYSYRDIRDVIVSLMYKKRVDFAKLRDYGIVYAILKEHEEWAQFGEILRSNYEDLLTDLPKEVSRIAAYLGCNISDEEALTIATEYSLERQKQRIHQRTSGQIANDTFGPKINAKNQLPDNHIHSGTQGRWRNMLTKREVALVEHLARDWMRKCGFSFSQNWLMRKSSGVSFHVRWKLKELLGKPN